MKPGETATRTAIAEVLRQTFPAAATIDFLVVADKILEACAIKSVQAINRREAASQKALQAVLDMYGEAMGGLQDRIDSLEAERSSLLLQLCQSIEPAGLLEER